MGGVALFWKRSLDNRVAILNIDDDRIAGIQYQISKDNYVYILQVYLPSSNHPISELDDYLLKLQDICSLYGEGVPLLIMGDFNVHFNGEKFVKPHDSRSDLFMQFLASNNLISINTLRMCTGALSTFVSYTGEQLSMIDHILIPVEKVDLISICDDDALNVSTHRPVYCHVNLPHAEQSTMLFPSVRHCVQWRGAKSGAKTKYRESVENMCLNDGMHVRTLNTAQDIDSMYKDITSVLSDSSKEHLPHRNGFKQYLKPYWDYTLKELYRTMRSKRRLWVLDNRPRGDYFETYRCYKQCKRVFRQYHRKCAENRLKSLNDEIDRAAEVNSEYFWRLISRRKNSNSNNVGCEIKFQNRACRDSEEICNEWGSFFCSLYSIATMRVMTVITLMMLRHESRFSSNEILMLIVLFLFEFRS